MRSIHDLILRFDRKFRFETVWPEFTSGETRERVDPSGAGISPRIG